MNTGLKSLGLGCLALALAAPMVSAEAPNRPTFTKDVLPILQENCQECHRPATRGTGGMVAPMSMITFEETRPWSKAIARAVSDKKMPPWFATEEFHNVFDNERVLTQDEIDTLVAWAETGAARGNPSDAPEPLKFRDSEWWNGDPDLLIELPDPVWVGDEVEDWQPNILVPLTEDIHPETRWLKGLEAQPGSEVVHHVVVFKDVPDGQETDRRFRFANLGGLAPGAENEFFNDGYGIKVEKGSTLRINMHYHKEPGPGTGTWDQSRVGMYWHDKGETPQEMIIEPIGNFEFEIPPHTDQWRVGMAEVFDRPFVIHSYLPHMHLRGSAAKYTAFFPDGTSEVILDIPEYNYDWQLAYGYPAPREFPAGTRLEVEMTFDNSVNNPSNPNPDIPIRFGQATTDEMALGWMTYTFTDEGATD